MDEEEVVQPALAIWDLHESSRVAVKCHHGRVLAIVSVTRRGKRGLSVLGSVQLPGSIWLGEDRIHTPRLLGAPWPDGWREIELYTGSKFPYAQACPECDFRRAPEPPPWPRSRR